LGVAQVSNEALSDSPISLQQTITDQFAKAYNALTDGNVLNGNGSSQFTGIIGHAATLSVARQTASQFSLVDAANMSAQMLPSSRNRACWVLSPGAWGQLLTFKDAAGRIVFWTGLDVTGAPAATLFGLPVYVNEHSPSLGTAGDVLLVDLSGYIIAQRMDISLMASTEFAFGQDLVTYRMVARYNGIPTYTAPFTLSNGTDTVSYAVQLGNASS
jgi:HK97 family phage major capsid protein